MPDQININASNKLSPAEDYYFLRSEGIKLIEKLSGNIWTDYNTHDPGITVLETLCYTLTDLGYRTSFDIKDLIAPDPANAELKKIFYTANEILPCNPVTLNDYRKLIIDTSGVKNAWIDISNYNEVSVYLQTNYDEPTKTENYDLTYDVSDKGPLKFKGLYKVALDFEDDVDTERKEKETIKRVYEKLNNHRNICEDFLSVSPIDVEKFKIEAEIQVKDNADLEKINARIFQVVGNFFSPAIHFYTLEQMLDSGYTPEEIFEGPLLKHGFIKNDELEMSERYLNVHLSDIIHLISDVEGVIAIKKITLPLDSQSAFSDFTLWIDEIKQKKKTPRLDIENSSITFIKNDQKNRSDNNQSVDKERVKAIYLFLQSEKKSTKLQGLNVEMNVPKGEYMDLADYYPFQHGLPASYGMEHQVVKEILDDEAIERAIAEVNSERNLGQQLSNKTSLLDKHSVEKFDKRLSSLSDDEKHQFSKHLYKHYLNNLEKSERQILQLRGFLMVFEQILADYLSQLSNLKALFSFDTTVNQTYFPQALNEINDIETLFKTVAGNENFLHPLMESQNLFIERRDSILNHLLARFGENMDIYGNEIKIAQKKPNKNGIHNKAAFLQEYISLSNYRSNGFNYRLQDKVWDTDNVIGAKKRICKLLGIQSYHTKLSTAEHIEIEEIKYPNGLVRFVVAIKHPESRNVLLKSIEYDSIAEISNILSYVLQNGGDENNYWKDSKHNKHTYGFKNWGQEDEFETIATNAYNTKEDLELNFSALIETLNIVSQNENLHVVEHILLRPKIDPQGKVISKRNNPISSTVVDFLQVPASTGVKPMGSHAHQDVSFKFKSVKVNDQSWRLALEKDSVEIFYVGEYLTSERHLENRIAHIRQSATDKTNFVTEKGDDGFYAFQLKDRNKVLAISKMEYQSEEDINVDIDSLVRFFAYEIHQAEDAAQGEEVDFSHADPYSFQISVLIPNWPARFRDPAFKNLLEKAIYMEVPAHVYANVHWLDYKGMMDFESTYKPWLEAIAEDEIPDTGIVNNLIYTLNELRKKN